MCVRLHTESSCSIFDSLRPHRGWCLASVPTRVPADEAVTPKRGVDPPSCRNDPGPKPAVAHTERHTHRVLPIQKDTDKDEAWMTTIDRGNQQVQLVSQVV